MTGVRLLIIPALCLISSCGQSSRNLTDDEKESAYLKLLGHWNDNGNHVYFAPLPEGEIYGGFTFIQAFQPDRVFHHRYSVLEDSPESVTMRIFYQGGHESQDVYTISRDGRSFTKTSHFGIEGLEVLDTIEESYVWVDDSYGPPL